MLTTPPIASFPDFSKNFRLVTDLSNKGVGATALAQMQDGNERLICCTSCIPIAADCNYSTTKNECLTIMWKERTFHSYLVGMPFETFTDNHSLQWLHQMKGKNAMMHHWLVELKEYDFVMCHRTHRPWRLQGYVDGLSQLSPQASTSWNRTVWP